MVNTFSLLVEHKDKSAKAAGLLKSISNYKFLHVTCVLADVLKHMSILCKSYQSSKLICSNVMPLLQATVDSVKLLQSATGPTLSEFLENVPAEPVNSQSVGCGTSFEHCGHVIKDNNNLRREASVTCVKFCTALIENLESKFTDKGEVMNALCKLFDPALYSGLPNTDVLSSTINIVLRRYIQTGLLVEHGVEQTDFTIEFQNFSNMLLKLSKKEHNEVTKSSESLCNFAISKSVCYPLVSKLAYLLLTLHVSSVDCERVFSRQNLIKTRLRSRLKTDNLEYLMTISMEGPPISDFDFVKGVFCVGTNERP